jgi:hypothetical protein
LSHASARCVLAHRGLAVAERAGGTGYRAGVGDGAYYPDRLQVEDRRTLCHENMMLLVL